MPNPDPATHDPAASAHPALFAPGETGQATVDGVLQRVPIEHLRLAPNPRREVSQESIDSLAALLMRTGQLIPCIGRRPDPAEPTVVLLDGQRRLLAAQASHGLAGRHGFEGLGPVRSLIVLLLDHDPAPDEIRRIQAHANTREALSLTDQQAQFADCWQARAGLADDERIAAVCADLGLSAKKAHNLRRQLTLPPAICERVAERPADGQLSVTMANRLADMHELAPQLTDAVAQRISSADLHDQALRDMGAFVHRTLVEDEHAYAVRIDDGALLDAAENIERAGGQMTSEHARAQAAQLLDCEVGKLQPSLDALARRARQRQAKITVTPEIRQRARAGRFAFVHDRGADFAAGIWIVDAVFVLDLAVDAVNQADDTGLAAGSEAYFAGAALKDAELAQAAADDREDRALARRRRHESERRNLGLGHDLRAGLIDPTPGQLQALKAIVCHLLAATHGELIAYGAGWTDRQRQQPVGDTGRHEPRHRDAILDAELDQALNDPEPLRGIAHLVARWAAAFVLDADGVTRTKALGSDRMARQLTDALPGAHTALRTAIWQFLAPMLSPALADMHRDAFVTDSQVPTTVDLAGHRADSDLGDLDLHDAA